MSRRRGGHPLHPQLFFERRLHRFYSAIHAAFLKHRISFWRGTENLSS
jgi:hypothetical protein